MDIFYRAFNFFRKIPCGCGRNSVADTTIMYYVWYRTLSNYLPDGHFDLMQVSFASITYCYQRHCCIHIWFFLWENPFDQAISKENLGGFYWCICYNYTVCICSENHLSLLYFFTLQNMLLLLDLREQYLLVLHIWIFTNLVYKTSSVIQPSVVHQHGTRCECGIAFLIIGLPQVANGNMFYMVSYSV